MGMAAEVIAIGPFSKDIVNNLEYPKELYANVKDGTKIAQNVFSIDSGSTESQKLAKAFKIDPWNFNQHLLNSHQADLNLLKELFSEEEVEDFVALRNAGFDFFFLPNG